jgi:hypothetical protein
MVLPLSLTLILLISIYIQKKNIKANKIYQFFVVGMICKVLAGLAISLLYLLYFKEGDMLGYFTDNYFLSKLLFKQPANFLKYILTEKFNVETIKEIFDTRIRDSYPQYRKGASSL